MTQLSDMLALDPMVQKERTGWRDLALSQRHRTWGWHCPGLDLDFLFLEYDRGEPTAIVEYKHEAALAIKPWHPSYLALIGLGDRAGLPVFLVRYAADFSWWQVRPMNGHAQAWLPDSSVSQMSEREWVALLYRLRGRTLPAELLAADEV